MKKPRIFTIEVAMDYVDLYVPEITKIIEEQKCVVISRSLYSARMVAIEFLFLATDDQTEVIQIDIAEDLGFDYNSETDRHFLNEEVWND